MSLNRPGYAAAAGLCVMVLAGWGSDASSPGPLVPVEGKVMMNGRPITDGYIIYFPDHEDKSRPSPQGKIEEDGSYRLTTRGENGAPIGKYRAYIRTGANRELQQAIDSKYLNERQSPLEIEVTENAPAA